MALQRTPLSHLLSYQGTLATALSLATLELCLPIYFFLELQLSKAWQDNSICSFNRKLNTLEVFFFTHWFNHPLVWSTWFFSWQFSCRLFSQHYLYLSIILQWFYLFFFWQIHLMYPVGNISKEVHLTLFWPSKIKPPKLSVKTSCILKDLAKCHSDVWILDANRQQSLDLHTCYRSHLQNACHHLPISEYTLTGQEAYFFNCLYSSYCALPDHRG